MDEVDARNAIVEVLRRSPGASLRGIAYHADVSVPEARRAVDGLVRARVVIVVKEGRAHRHYLGTAPQHQIPSNAVPLLQYIAANDGVLAKQLLATGMPRSTIQYQLHQLLDLGYIEAKPEQPQPSTITRARRTYQATRTGHEAANATPAKP